MTTGYKFGHQTISGVPEADWSHAASYLADKYKDSLYEDLSEDAVDKDQAFRQRLLAVRGVDGLSDEDRALASGLADADGVDIEHFPGGSKYRVSMVSDSNPLGLPGDLWALVTSPAEGALVAALMKSDEEGELWFLPSDGVGWIPLTDLGVVSDYTIVGVKDEAVRLFHNYDRDNTLGVVSSYPLAEAGPYPTTKQLEIPMSGEIPPPREPDDEYWNRTGESYDEYRNPSKSGVPNSMTASVVVNSVEDLGIAISAAMNNSDLRWYVERRINALGLEADLPWAEG